MKVFWRILVSLMTVAALVQPGNNGNCKQEMVKAKMDNLNRSGSQEVLIKKHVLANGMTVLVYPIHTVPKVSVQMWYNVGSKDEATGEKGIAHLIEHMIFKGTEGEKSLFLSESDINMIVHMLSGSCNAFTTQDFTGYLFNMPTHNWKHVLPIIADCMTNCAFKDEHLNSEMKAVIQELKMRNDNYTSTIAEMLLTAIFSDHPYHYPIIGFKQDLWTVSGQDLKKFYKKHYVPNNATLIVVGDVDSSEVIAASEKYFSAIKPNREYERPTFYFGKDIVSKSVTLYREVSNPTVLLAYTVPGLSAKKKHLIDLLSWILGSGKSSRLCKRLVDEYKMVTSLGTYHWDWLFDHSIFFIIFEPKDSRDIEKITQIIHHEIDDLKENGPHVKELTRAIKQSQMQYYSTQENMQEQAFSIGKYFLATGDEHYMFNYLNQPLNVLGAELQDVIKSYLRSSVVNKGVILPLSDDEKSEWLALQGESDKLDKEILSARQRSSSVEPPVYLKKIEAGTPGSFSFPKAKSFNLKNKLKVLYHHNEHTPKIDISLHVKANGYYDPVEKQGLYNFMTAMMTEGTKNYTATEFADELESRGMSLDVSPHGITLSLLHDDLPIGLEFLCELLTQAIFDKKEIEKVRAQIQASIKNFWDSPQQLTGQVIREAIYKGHPYSKNALGSQKVVASITQKDLIDLYKKYIVPAGARLAIVGDLSGYDIQALVTEYLGKWSGDSVADPIYPKLSVSDKQEILYPMNRDQVVLAFGRLSVERTHPDYDKLAIFDQILGGGMSSRLFQLREQSGLFYSIAGSLLVHADKQPGIFLVKTLVSLDRLEEAERVIKETLTHVADNITDDEFEQAKNAILTATVQHFESNAQIAGAFLFLDKFDFPAGYFDERAGKLQAITKQDVLDAVKKIITPEAFKIFKVGRVLQDNNVTPEQ